MNKFIRLLPIMGLLLPVSLSAADYPWLTFKMTDNSEVSVAADNLQINYGNEALYLKSATVDQSFPVAQIQTMRFTTTSAGINDVVDNPLNEADYFTVSGVNVGRFMSIDDARRQLPSGVYVVKSETKSLKVIF